MDLIKQIYNQIGLKDVFDIFLVSLIIYQFLLIVRGTRAVQMIFGVVAIGAIYALGQIYQLYSLNWVLEHFFNSFFIIVIILFQEQIRTGLASFGVRRKMFGGVSRPELENEIDEVSEVCGLFSKEKIGALIVFEKENGLLNYIETGVKIEANVKSDLLYAIFQSRSSLHDGSVIISKGQILGAGCFLPLTKSVEVDKHMGTRHRAGLGLSEVTDAVVVVVSEESGKIHLCFKGQFYACADGQDLRRKLRPMLLGPMESSEASVVTGGG